MRFRSRNNLSKCQVLTSPSATIRQQMSAGGFDPDSTSRCGCEENVGCQSLLKRQSRSDWTCMVIAVSRPGTVGDIYRISYEPFLNYA